MTHLKGVPLATHLEAIFSEYESHQSIYNLKNKFMFKGFDGIDLQTKLHGKNAATPLGPAAGPHTQLTQNIILSYLAGSRIVELKTVQILDKLEITRPCIDIRNIGFNVEWSQELSLHESKDEYIKAYIILKILKESEILGPNKGSSFYDFIFDLSVGYDLKGIVSPQVNQWLKTMIFAQKEIAQQLKNLPTKFAPYRDLEIDPQISNSITLSTFHGCPPKEIEKIVEYLISEYNLHVVVKLNPTLLGYDFVHHTLNTELGYENLILDKSAFDADLKFDDAVLMMSRLKSFAANHNKSVGAKFTNTLVVKNNENFFDANVRYLSGAPLHVLAMKTMHALRESLGNDFLMSFSGGINKDNFADAIACNLKPVTTCTDLLKRGGYSRLFYYLRNLTTRMQSLDSCDIGEFIRASSKQKEADVLSAGGLNSKRYSKTLSANPKYHFAQNQAQPKHVDSSLTLFDCLSCNLCVSVCPNASNIALSLGKHNISFYNYVARNGRLKKDTSNEIKLEKPLQFMNLADSCNECGNCDIYCPEQGAPFVDKARFFFSQESFQQDQNNFAMLFESPHKLNAKIGDQKFCLTFDDTTTRYKFSNAKSCLILDSHNKLIEKNSKTSLPEGEILDMAPYYTMRLYLDGFLNNPNHFSAIMLQRDNNE